MYPNTHSKGLTGLFIRHMIFGNVTPLMHLRFVDAFHRSILGFFSTSGPRTISKLNDDSTRWSADQLMDCRSFRSPTLSQISPSYSRCLNYHSKITINGTTDRRCLSWVTAALNLRCVLCFGFGHLSCITKIKTC